MHQTDEKAMCKKEFVNKRGSLKVIALASRPAYEQWFLSSSTRLAHCSVVTPPWREVPFSSGSRALLFRNLSRCLPSQRPRESDPCWTVPAVQWPRPRSGSSSPPPAHGVLVAISRTTRVCEHLAPYGSCRRRLCPNVREGGPVDPSAARTGFE